MVFRQGKQLSILDLPGVQDASIRGAPAMIRGFDKVDRRPYRSPILTYVTSRKFALKAIADPWVTAICLTEELYKDLDSHAFGGRTAILSDDPVSFFFGAHNELAETTDFYWGNQGRPKIGQGAQIHSSAIIDSGVTIGNNVSVGAGAIILRGSKIGDGSVVMAGSIIGEESLEIKQIQGRPQKVHHVGGVKIGVGCVFGPHVVVSRNVFHGHTSVGDFTTVGEKSHISHGVKIGSKSTLTSGVLTGGHCTIGDKVFVGMGATIKQLITIGDASHISMAASVITDVARGQRVTGLYAKDSRRWAAEQLRLENRSTR